MQETIYIKNMVCQRCIKVIQDEIKKLGYDVSKIKLGEIIINYENEIDIEKIKNVLNENGFEILDNKQRYIIEQIKIVIIAHIQSFEKSENLSDYLARKIGYSYQYLSNLFSSFEDYTIENYIITQRIEKAKELLVYNQLTLSEISYRLKYSSVQHLSSQFKKVTGFTPTKFKKLKNKNRIPLDKV